MRRIYQSLALALITGAGCHAATVAEMTGTVFTAHPQEGAGAAPQPVLLYLAAGVAALYVVLRHRRA